jgi:predicted DNA-binding transcriptional regulator AlpA
VSAAENEETKDNTVALIAALVAGDRWLSAEACAAYIGGIKRRTFLEKIACRPDFPAPAKVLGTTKVWRKSEVDAWVDRQRPSRAA